MQRRNARGAIGLAILACVCLACSDDSVYRFKSFRDFDPAVEPIGIIPNAIPSDLVNCRLQWFADGSDVYLACDRGDRTGDSRTGLHDVNCQSLHLASRRRISPELEWPRGLAREDEEPMTGKCFDVMEAVVRRGEPKWAGYAWESDDGARFAYWKPMP